MNDCMTFPDTVEEFMEQYKVVDTEHIYTNGSEFVPIFRMKQWFEHLPSEQSEPEAISKWKKEFREYVDSLDIARDDWKGIIEYIGELPSVQPNHCAEVGKKVLIDRQEALEIIRKMQTYKLFAGDDMILVDKAQVQTELMMLPSAQSEVIRCKDCIYQTESWSGIKYCEAHGDHIGTDYDYCSNAREKENG